MRFLALAIVVATLTGCPPKSTAPTQPQSLAREDRLAVVDVFTVDAPKTRLLAEKLRGMGLDDVLIITDALDDNLRLSSRNLANVDVVDVRGADPVTLIRHSRVVMTRIAIAKFEELLA